MCSTWELRCFRGYMPMCRHPLISRLPLPNADSHWDPTGLKPVRPTTENETISHWQRAVAALQTES